MLRCTCCIVPKDLLERLAADRTLPAPVRKSSADTARASDAMQRMRRAACELTAATCASGAHLVELADKPKITVYDCKGTQSLPGTPLRVTKRTSDETARRVLTETTAVAKFYRTVFGRNSIDNAGMTMMSSIHFGRGYNNAMWNGGQMIYGDGDGRIFVDFTRARDVIGHELTHGVTQYTLQLAYEGDAGGLNESLSDCFGAMFRQWATNEDVNEADWLIGTDLIGPLAKRRGFSALRSMLDPADKGVLSPQPKRYSQLKPGMDPHLGSGPPNLAFSTACRLLGGKSWVRIGQVWYGAMTESGPAPRMSMPQFASRTRQVALQRFSGEAKVAAAIDDGWKAVGL